jgi:hypothetical protein
MKYRLERINELVVGVEAEGKSGLLRALARMIDPEGPSADCIQATDDAMDSAVGDEQYYDAALGMATCLRQIGLAPEPEVPEPEEPDPDEPEPEPEPGDNLGHLVLKIINGRSYGLGWPPAGPC